MTTPGGKPRLWLVTTIEGKIATPVLILCKSNDDQTFHLDLPDSGSQKQFGMTLNNNQTTTIICKPCCNTVIRDSDSLVSLIGEGIDLIANGSWMMPSPALVKKMKDMGKKSEDIGNRM